MTFLSSPFQASPAALCLPGPRECRPSLLWLTFELTFFIPRSIEHSLTAHIIPSFQPFTTSSLLPPTDYLTHRRLTHPPSYIMYSTSAQEKQERFFASSQFAVIGASQDQSRSASKVKLISAIDYQPTVLTMRRYLAGIETSIWM